MFVAIRGFLIALVFAIIACFAQVPTASAQYVHYSDTQSHSWQNTRTMVEGFEVSVWVLHVTGWSFEFSGWRVSYGPTENIFWSVRVECVVPECQDVPVFYRNGEKGVSISETEIVVEADSVKLTLARGELRSSYSSSRDESNFRNACLLNNSEKGVQVGFEGSLEYGGNLPIVIGGDLNSVGGTQYQLTPNKSCFGSSNGGDGKG